MEEGWGMTPSVKRVPKRTVTPFTGHPNARFYSVRSMAEILDTSMAKVRGMISAGDLQAVRVRGQFRVSIAEFNRKFPAR